MKKTIIAVSAVALLLGAASCKSGKKVEEDTVRIENDSTTIIVSEDTTVKVDTVQTVEQAPAAANAVSDSI